MKVSRFIAPYARNGKTNLGFAQGKAGVYIIEKDGTIAYVGYSATNLYSTVLRHFQSWDDKRQVRVTYYGKSRSKFKVRIILCQATRAAKLEKALIVKYSPKDNPDKLKGYKLTTRDEQVFTEYQFEPVATIKELEEAPF